MKTFQNFSEAFDTKDGYFYSNKKISQNYFLPTSIHIATIANTIGIAIIRIIISFVILKSLLVG